MLAAVLAVVAGSPLAQAEAAPASDRERPNGEPLLLVSSARPAPSLGERAAGIAVRAVGIPYRYGGESPTRGFDCSGLVRWAYGRLGVDLPHSSYALAVTGRRVESERLLPGDVLLFDGLGHVGLYLGRGRMVHAPQSGRAVEVVALRSTAYGGRLVGARRIVPA
jgi:chitinase